MDMSLPIRQTRPTQEAYNQTSTLPILTQSTPLLGPSHTVLSLLGQLLPQDTQFFHFGFVLCVRFVQLVLQRLR